MHIKPRFACAFAVILALACTSQVAHTPIDYHEALTMGGVQAVRTGSIPYIDAAAVQYGPLAQVANVAYVGLTGRLSVDGFREVTLLFQWLAATLFEAVWPALFGALAAALVRRSPPWAIPVALAAAWTAVDWLRTLRAEPRLFPLVAARFFHHGRGLGGGQRDPVDLWSRRGDDRLYRWHVFHVAHA